MPLNKSRFYHERSDDAPLHGGRFKGFSIKLSPNALVHQLVGVQVTFCSKKDPWCFKNARQACEKSPVEYINVTELPKFLRHLSDKVWNIEHDEKYEKSREFGNPYAWILKYFL